MKVKKRNGEIVDFKRNKVFGAITRASESMNIKDKNLIRSITDKVITKLGDREEVNVEYIQDIVEETLMEEKQFLIARAYILWRQSRNASRQVASSMGVVNDLKLPVSSLTVLAKRYLLRNIDGDIIETPKELYKRVSTAIAKIEEKQGTSSKEIKTLTKEFYDFMASGTFLPNSPCLFSAGTEMSQLSACFTLNIDDSLESIFDVLKKSAKIFQTGGGVGYNFSNIRPKDDVVRSTKGVSSGPLSFMKVYNEMCEIIKQGSFRRGAMMGILDVNHPNILDFIIMKGKEGYLSNFNISVAVTDNFMKAVKTNKDIQLVNPRTGKPIQSIPASAIWDLLVTEAWKTGDPGLVFIDTVNKSESNVVPKLGPIKSCNPCGEIFMYPSESCNLGSLNLTKFTKEKEDGTGLEFDFNKLGEAVKLAIRFLDNVIDANKYPTQEIQDMSLRLRRIGLGVMGWADTLILLKIPYDSQEALDLAGKVMGFITKTATKTSVELGERRGSFPEFEDSIWVKRGYKHMRNSAVTCIAPTGSISILAGCSQSIEPLMSVVTVRNLEETLGSKLVDVNPLFQQEAIKRGFWSEELMNKVSRTLSIQNMQEIPEDVRRIFVTAMDVKPEWHVRMQAAFQANTHNACSKTINLPHNATPHDVEEAFMLAWKLGAKGITVFRDGCLRKQVFTCVECEVPT